MEAEVGLGHHPRGVSRENLGYDIASLESATGRLRAIEVKGGLAGDSLYNTQNAYYPTKERPMTAVQRVSRTELARNTRRVLTDVQRRRTTLIESHGKAKAAVLDIIDYRILRAVARAHTHVAGADPEGGLSAGEVQAMEEPQARCDLILARYLQGSIGLSRAAELLDVPWLELRTRFGRLDVPVRTAPPGRDEVVEDLLAVDAW